MRPPRSLIAEIAESGEAVDRARRLGIHAQLVREASLTARADARAIMHQVHVTIDASHDARDRNREPRPAVVLVAPMPRRW